MAYSPAMETVTAPPGARLLDALSLAAEAADQLLVGTARDTHLAISSRVDRVLRPATGGASTLPSHLHRGIAQGVYACLGVSLRAASRGLDRLGAAGLGPGLEDTARGRFVSAAVNGLIGDRLLEERPHLAIGMSVRRADPAGDVATDARGLAAAFPDASDSLVVFLHGLCEDETYWRRGADELGTTYPLALAGQGWTPLLLRANTGLGLRRNGVELRGLMQEVVDHWPVPVRRIALVGHSMGGLIIRAAGAVETDRPRPWTDLVTDVVTLGTPHLGAPIARGVGHGSRGLGVLPETAAFGRFLDWRSLGVRDLVEGLTADVPPLPHARYRLVAATLTRSPRHPVGFVAGDLLVRERSAYGEDPGGETLFPGAERLHVGCAHHFDLLNHPEIHAALRRWLGAGGPAGS